MEQFFSQFELKDNKLPQVVSVNVVTASAKREMEARSSEQEGFNRGVAYGLQVLSIIIERCDGN